MKTVLITGASGFIGRLLCDQLTNHAYSLICLSRNPDQNRHTCPDALWIDSLDAIPEDKSVDIVINLAGAPIAKSRWSDRVKAEILRSRIDFTEALYQFFKHQSTKPTLLINGSAIGYYGPQGDCPVDESSDPVDCFSHQLCSRWETTAMKFSEFGTVVCLLRFGIVLDRDGGALKSMLPAFTVGLGGIMGTGKQWMSWIHRQDVVNLIQFCVENEVTGAVNAVAPHPATNREFSKALAKAISRPCLLKTPAWLLRLLLGEMAQELLLSGQKVLPDRAQKMNFAFTYSTLAHAFKAIFTKKTFTEKAIQD